MGGYRKKVGMRLPASPNEYTDVERISLANMAFLRPVFSY